MDSNSFYNEVLSMLQSGQDMTAIAKRITEDMNKAQADYKAAQKANQIKARKQELVGNIYDAVEAYLQEFAPDMMNSMKDRDDNINTVIEGLDAFIELGHEVPLKGALKDADEVLTEWLNKLDL